MLAEAKGVLILNGYIIWFGPPTLKYHQSHITQSDGGRRKLDKSTPTPPLTPDTHTPKETGNGVSNFRRLNSSYKEDNQVSRLLPLKMTTRDEQNAAILFHSGMIRQNECELSMFPIPQI